MVANGAVGAPGRPVKLAGDAPFHAHSDAVDLDIPVKRSAKVVVPVFVCGGARDDTRVHKCGQTERGVDSMLLNNLIIEPPKFLSTVSLAQCINKQEGRPSSPKVPNSLGERIYTQTVSDIRSTNTNLPFMSVTD